MEGLPKELFYVLIFVGIVLFQYLVKRFAPQAQQPDAAPEDPLWELPEEAVEAPAASSSRVTGGHFGRTEMPSVPVRPRGRRFSRESLLGNRRDLQRAVVLATILGPCRAMEAPGGNDDAGTGPRQATP